MIFLDVLDISQFRFDGDFETQANEILSKVRLTRTEVESLSHLFSDLENALHSTWPGKKRGLRKKIIYLAPFTKVILKLKQC